MASDSPVLLWFRKDLRLDDNLALVKSVKSNRPIIPLYIWPLPDTESADAAFMPLGSAQRWWLHHSLNALAASLGKRGSRLIVRSGNPVAVLKALALETGANVVAVNSIPDPRAGDADGKVRLELESDSIAFHAFDGALLHDPDKLKTGGGSGFRVYTPFWRALNQQAPPSPPLEAPLLDAAGNWRQPNTWPQSEPVDHLHLLPSAPDWAVHFSDEWQPGEAGATIRLRQFLDEGMQGYATNRDIPGLDGTSRLSPHLALGEISPRRIWQEIDRMPSGEASGPNSEDKSRYLKELVWREFSYHLLHHFPDLATRNWNGNFDSFRWREDREGFDAWKRGMTGYPIVDAGMRQLWKHGWMHNRVRMIVASFLIKDLLIDWRLGERWFRDTLVDADPGSNAASWQWVAGSGADASPFFRVFNPILQGEKFDPDGVYIRRFVPELANLPDHLIHKPFDATLLELRAAGVSLGKTYPLPVVDHRMARDRALAELAHLKGENKASIKNNKNS